MVKGRGGQRGSLSISDIREMKAKREKDEERYQREEEERIMKEVEERLRNEELERQLEEQKRLKKEREKAKRLEKQKQGIPVTQKQKEEAKKLEAGRNRLLAGTGGVLPLLATGESGKKPPFYRNKTRKLKVELDVDGSVDEAKLSSTGLVETDETEVIGIVKEEDCYYEWDSRSWDEAELLKLSGKSPLPDEQVELELEPLSKEPKIQDVLPVKEDRAMKSEVATGPVLRSPICCIMGHVDSGKTKLLDCIRGTDVQGGEAGGITQQIGATYIPADNIRERTKELKADAKLNVPGLLVIDTPGHEAFNNMRSRGSVLCDIAVLVVSIMDGLEKQTIESLKLLKKRKTEFMVALNKVDRLYGWKTCKNAPIREAMKHQSKDVRMEFNQRLAGVINQFQGQGLNTELYYKNKDMGETFNIVPTSAMSGEGIPDLLLLLVQWTGKTMVERLTFRNEVQCTILEVKVVEGLGTTVDVVLVNGVLHEGDQIVVCSLQGPIVTTIRSLLTPHPMKEIRTKGAYLHHKEIKASQAIKITAQGLEPAIAGTSIYCVEPGGDLEDVEKSARNDMISAMRLFSLSDVGVQVNATTFGSLEVLLKDFKSHAFNIPVSGVNWGPVQKRHVMKSSIMLEKNKKVYATILAFEVKVTQEARELAKELGVKILSADTIYELFGRFKAHMDTIKEQEKEEAADKAVFPCILKILPNNIFNKKDPIVLGVRVLQGIAKVGTPLCVQQNDFLEIGRIASIEINNRVQVDFAHRNSEVAIKIIGVTAEEKQMMLGRHFHVKNELVSKITRDSADAFRKYFAEEVTQEVLNLLDRLESDQVTLTFANIV